MSSNQAKYVLRWIFIVTYVFKSFKTRHLKVIHFVKNNVSEIRCVVNDECKHKYNSFKALSLHVGTCSKNIEANTNNTQSIELVENENIDNSEFDGFVVPRNEGAEGALVQSSFVYGEKSTNQNIDEFLDTFSSEVIALGLNYKGTDTVFKLCEELTESMKLFCSEATNVVDVSNYMSTKFHSLNS